jgi:uncharacterized protein YutE (UPF0331/DUF86 family)
MVRALAWPGVVVVLLFLLRPHFAGLAARLQTLKLPGGGEAQFFRMELEKAKADAQSIRQRTGKTFTRDAAPDIEKIRSEDDAFHELSKMFPEAAVMQSFLEVEQALDDLAVKLNLPRGRARVVVETLRQRALMDDELHDLYKRLSNLRNIAAHRSAGNITQDEAVEYRSLAVAAASQLRRIAEKI